MGETEIVMQEFRDIKSQLKEIYGELKSLSINAAVGSNEFETFAKSCEGRHKYDKDVPTLKKCVDDHLEWHKWIIRWLIPIAFTAVVGSGAVTILFDRILP